MSPTAFVPILPLSTADFFLPVVSHVGQTVFLAESVLRGWWLPPNYSAHGAAMDRLFYCIFFLSVVIMLGVFGAMALFVVKYRYKPGRKAIYSHGNTKLEMIWTLIPAVILIVLSLWAKKVWDDYRYSSVATDPNLARIMVVAEQFNWNTIYPGPDGKLGRYLVFPKTTDMTWPGVPADKSYSFPQGVPGPAFLPEAKARKTLDDYVQTINPIGKDMTDPNGKDDDWESALGRPVVVPKGRPVEITLASKDVIHDFFLPNFRVKLDAVPGMRGLIYFTPLYSSKDLQEPPKKYSLDALAKAAGPTGGGFRFSIPADDSKATDGAQGRGYYYSIKTTVKKRVQGKMQDVTTTEEVVVKTDDAVIPSTLDALKEAGISDVMAYTPKTWDLVCEELCGAGHTAMKGTLIVLEADEYRKKFETAGATASAK